MSGRQRHRRVIRPRARIVITIVTASVVAGGILTAVPAPADAYISETFTGSTLTGASNWSTSNAGSGAVCLTGLSSSASAISLNGSSTLPGCTTSPDAVGTGALRLVGPSTGQSGSIFYKDPQSTAYGLDITFTLAMEASGPAYLIGNGMSFFLKDGSNAVDTAGPGGAPLGYARYSESGQTPQNGVPGGLVGIGFDVYGAYADSDYFTANGCNASGQGPSTSFLPNMLGVRGPDTSAPKDGSAGYCWIDGTTSPGTLYAASRGAAKRNVRIVVDPASVTTPKVKVYVGAAGGGAVPGTPTLEFDQPNELKTATSFKFGFSASTGAAVLGAYVWDVLIKKPNTQVLYVVPANYTYSYGTSPGTITPTFVYQTTLGDASTNVANPASGNTGWTAPTCSATGTFNGTTSAGTYSGAIGCTGGSGGTLYTLDNTSAANVIVSKVNPTCTVTPYSTTYTGSPITATGSCTGVGGVALAGLDLTGTTHTNVGTYPTDAWTFTDVTGNYNNTSGTVSNTITAAPTPTPSPTSPASQPAAPSPASRPVAPSSASAVEGVDPLAPLVPVQGAGNPAVGLAAGGAMLMVGGSRVPVSVAPNSRRNPAALLVSAPGLTPPMSMRMEGRGSPDAGPLGLTSGQMLILQSEQGSTQPAASRQPVLVASGEGLKPNTPVRVYLLPSTFLGTMTTDARGAYGGTIPVPPGITPGVHIIQVNAFAPDNSIRSVSLAALVKPRTATVKATARRIGVPFTALSSRLTSRGKAALRALVRNTCKQSITVRCYAYVPAGSGKKAVLTTARAKAVAAYLRKLGVNGAYVVKGNSRTGKSAARANRINVMIVVRAQ